MARNLNKSTVSQTWAKEFDQHWPSVGVGSTGCPLERGKELNAKTIKAIPTLGNYASR
jgi:hypothetical protein